MKSKNFVFLIVFCGAGSKLLQSQLGNSKETMTIPAYPLLYLYPHYLEWKKKYRKLSVSLSYKLISKYHASIFDSRRLKGFGGLDTLGNKKNEYLFISKSKFKKNYFSYLKKKTVNYVNIVKSIHFAYQKCINNNGHKILFHSHDIEWFQKGIRNDFTDSKIIFTTRHPLTNFWRRIHADIQIENERFNYTDQEYLKNYHYINRIKNFYISFACLGNNLNKKNSIFVRFEDIKNNNKKILKNLCKFIGVRFNYKELFTPKFRNKIWWGSKIYKGYDKSKYFIKSSFEDKSDFKNFFYYELLLLEILLYPYIKVFNYKFYTIAKNPKLHFLIFLIIFFPTKNGIKIFFQRLKLSRLMLYIKNIFYELKNKNLKNYYENAMYKHKWTYREHNFFNNNLIRKKIFYSKNKKSFQFLKTFYFIYRFLRYFYYEFELIYLYFYRIYFFLKCFFTIKNKVKFIRK
tara:strand:- start:1789 stop:3165 length:1377 start_codon:yes stop_codon:yes gene_type:complete